jgi:hypothetical protein
LQAAVTPFGSVFGKEQWPNAYSEGCSKGNQNIKPAKDAARATKPKQRKMQQGQPNQALPA